MRKWWRLGTIWIILFWGMFGNVLVAWFGENIRVLTLLYDLWTTFLNYDTAKESSVCLRDWDRHGNGAWCLVYAWFLAFSSLVTVR